MGYFFNAKSLDIVLRNLGFSVVLMPGAPDEIFPEDNIFKRMIKLAIYYLLIGCYKFTGKIYTNTIMAVAKK